MKKKILLTLSVIALLIVGLLAFTACDNDPDRCSHEWSKWKTTVEATCSTEGVLERQCSKCSTVQTDTLRVTSHKGGVATCSALAVCETCGQSYGEFTTHKYDVMSTEAIYKITDATCDHAAEYYYSCACGEKSANTFTVGEALGHSYIYISNGDGTHTAICTNEEGNETTVECSGGTAGCIDAAECAFCGESYGEALGHNWVQGAITVSESSSACESGEKILYTCSHCLTTKVEIIPPVGHDYKSVVTLPTCNTIGYTTHTCEKCQDSYVDSQVQPTNAHVWDHDRTCESGHSCTVCGTTEAALEHDYEVIASTVANCTNPATKTYKCKNCTEEYDEIVSAALGHNTAGVLPTEEPVAGTTCEYTQFYSCTACGTKVNGGTVKHHSYTATVAEEANCQEVGTKLYTCSKCNHSYEEDIPVDANNHVWNDGVKDNGTIKYNCTKCSAEKTVVDASSSSNATVDSSVLGSSGVEFKDDIKLDMSEVAGDGGALSGAGNVNISAGTLSDTERDSAKEGLTDEQKEQLGDNPIYNFTVSDANGEISNFGEKYVTITLPYTLEEGEDVDSIAVWYMEGDTLVSIKASYANGYVTFKTNHFSYYTVTRLTPEERCALYGCQYSEKVVEATCLTDGYTLKVCIRCKESVKTNIVTATGHNYTDVETPATCTKAGKIVSTCSCGHSYTKRIPATGHNYVVETKAATCEEDGYENGLCACGAKYSKKTPKLVHKLTATVVAPTCENGGYTLYDCDNCNYSYKANITAAIGHNIKATWTWAENHKKADVTLACENGCGLEVSEKNVKVSEKNVEPTCYKSGRMECTVKYVYNGVTYSDTYVEDKGTVDHVFGDDWKHNKHNHWHSCKNCSGPGERFQHEFGEGIVTKKPTCKSEGEMSYVCFCGETKVESIPRTNEHRYANGVCADCNTKLECTHDYGEGTVTKAPTCTEDGVKTFVCSICQGTKVETIASLGGHAYDEGVVTTAPTCEAAGVKTYTCSVCQATKTEAIAALGHAYDEGVVTTPNSCLTAGVKTYTCSNCQGTKTEEIAAIGSHSFNAGEVTTAPTCTLAGVKTFTCTVCSATATEAIPALPDHVYEGGVCVYCGNEYTCIHVYDSGVITTAPTCTEEGVKTFTCTKCGGTKSEAVASLGGHSYNAVITVAPSCMTGGIKTFTCSACANSYTETIPPIGYHTYNDGAVTTAPTCTEEGVKTFTCTVCQATKTEAVAANGHSYNDGVVTTAPTCTAAGVKTFTCTACADSYTEEIASLGGHNYVDGVCSVCGAEYNGAYYINLINSFKDINSVSIKLNDVSFKLNEKDESFVGGLRLVGSLKQIDVAELSLGFVDGELKGSVKGSVEVFSLGEGTITYGIDALIEEGFVYACINIGGEYNYMKASIDALMSSVVGEIEFGASVAAVASQSIFSEIVIPAIAELVDANTDKVNEILGKIFNIIFTTEENADGSFTVTLDYDKLSALNENLASKTVAELIDIYFGEGSFDSIVEKITEILNLKVSELADYVDSLGLDSEALIEKINEFVIEYTAETDFDLNDYLADEEYADKTLGMLISNSDDDSYLEEFNEGFTEILSENTFYGLIDERHAEDIKEVVGGIVDAASETAEISFATDSEGAFKSFALALNSFVYSYEEIELSAGGELELVVNGSVDAEDDGIIDIVESGIVEPSDDLLENDSEIYLDVVKHYNSIKYNGKYYSVENALVVDYTEILYDNLTAILYKADCQGFNSYSAAYNGLSYEFMFAFLNVDGEEIFVICDIITGEAVELRGDENSFLAIYEDGSEKQIGIGDLDSYENVQFAYLDVYFAVFEDAEGIVYPAFEGVNYYYNATTGEYAESTHHKIESETVLNGETCADGRTYRDYCLNCDYENAYTSYSCVYSYGNTVLDFGGACCPMEAYAGICDFCENVSHIQNAEFNCKFENMTKEEIFDEDGNSVGVRMEGTCEVCGLVARQESRLVAEGCEIYNEDTISAYLNGECLFKVGQVWNHSSNHEWEPAFEMLGETCEDGYLVMEVCKICGEKREYGMYSGHAYSSNNKSLEELGTCAGTVARGDVCQICGDERFTTVEPGCKEYIPGAMLEKTDPNGVVYYEQSFTCAECSATFSVKYFSTKVGCVTETVVVSDVVINGETVYTQTFNAGKMANHEWETTYELYGETCNEGYDVIEICKNCDSKNIYSNGGHIRKYEEINLAEYGFCGGTIYCESCDVCGYIFNAEPDLVCSDFETSKEEFTNEEGIPVRVTNTFICNTCGCKIIVEAGLEYEIGNECEQTQIHSTKYYDASGALIKEFTNSESYVEHNYVLSYALPFGDECYRGYYAKYTCENCGDTHSEYGTEHITERNSINFAEHGMCGGYVEEEKCVICGTYTYSNINVWECKWETVEHDDESGRMLAVCSNCNATRIVSTTEGEKDEECRYQVTNLEIYINAENEEVYRYENIWWSADHNSVAEAELKGESCEDGYSIKYTCLDCGDISYTWADRHEAIIVDEYDLSEYGACGGYAEKSSCPCGYYSHFDFELDCDYTESYGSYEDENGIQHDTATFTCEACKLSLTLDRYIANEGCDYAETCVVNLTVDGEAVISDYVSVSERWDTHEYEYSFNLYGENCHDGYEVIMTCHKCGDTHREEGYDHEEYTVLNVNLYDFGACGGFINIRRCACGEWSNVESNEHCMYESESTSYEDGIGNSHTVWTYTCHNCGLVKVRDEYTVKDEKCNVTSYITLSISKDGVDIVPSFEYTSGKYQQHNFKEEFKLFGTSCNDGYEKTATCVDCGYSYIGRGSGHSTSVKERYDLSEAGACGGYVEIRECPCGEIKNLNYNSYCKMRETSSDGYKDKNGIYHSVYTYACMNCSLVKTEDRYSVDGENCYVYDYCTVSYSIGDNVIIDAYTYISGYYQEHDYENQFIMNNPENCEDGYRVFATCRDCQDSYESEYYYSHNGYTQQYVDLSEYGADGCYIETYECPCGERKHYNYYIPYENEYEYSYDQETQHSFTTHTYTELGFVITQESWTVKEGCYNVNYQKINFFVGDTQLISDFTYEWSRNEAHEYDHDFVMNGESCLDGYTVIYTCLDCGSSYENNYDYHNIFPVEKYDLSEFGACGGYIELQECPCGAYASTNTYSDCDYSESYKDYEDELKNHHDVWTYTCEACGSCIVRDYYYLREGCEDVRYCDITISVCDEEKANFVYASERYTSHNYTYIVANKPENCEDGYTVTYSCRDCGYSYDNNYNHHEGFLVEEYDLTEFGACDGYVNYYSCACGKEQRVDFGGCNNNYTSNEYYDGEGRLIYTEVRSCDTCKYRFTRSYYTVKDSESCTLTYYYTVLANVGAELVADIRYERSEPSHDYKITSTLDGESCNDGVTLHYQCKDCEYNYDQRYNHHYSYDKETVELGSVCGGYAVLRACACGYESSLDLDHALCDFDIRGAEGNENAIPGGWYNLFYADDTSVHVTNSSIIYTCAVTDPDQCAYKIRKAEYYIYDGDGCTASRYVTWQFGYNEETGECEREITYKTPSKATVHKYQDTEISDTLSDGTTVSGRLKTCATCGTSCYFKNYYNTDGVQVKYERKFVNKIDDGNYKHLEELSEYIGNHSTKFGNYTTRYYFKRVEADGNEHSYEDLYEYDFDYVASFGENSYVQKMIHNEDGNSYVEENGYTEYNGYRFNTYLYRTESDFWYRYDYSYNFEGCCMKTEVYTNSNGENTTKTEEWHYTNDYRNVAYSTCTQDGKWENYCPICYTVTSSGTSSPNRHDWYYVDENHYFCISCGLENINGADGVIVMEDLTARYGNGEYYVIGYWNQDSVEFLQYVSLMLKTPMEDGNDEIALDGIEFVELDGIRAIAFKKSDVEALALELGYDKDDYLVKFSFVPLGDDGSLDYGITFTEEEAIPEIISDDFNVICKDIDGDLTLSVKSDVDTVIRVSIIAGSYCYTTLCNADGNLVNSNGGSVYDFLCELAAGETYVLNVSTSAHFSLDVDFGV